MITTKYQIYIIFLTGTQHRGSESQNVDHFYNSTTEMLKWNMSKFVCFKFIKMVKLEFNIYLIFIQNSQRIYSGMLINTVSKMFPHSLILNDLTENANRI